MIPYPNKIGPIVCIKGDILSDSVYISMLPLLELFACCTFTENKFLEISNFYHESCKDGYSSRKSIEYENNEEDQTVKISRIKISPDYLHLVTIDNFDNLQLFNLFENERVNNFFIIFRLGA